MIKNSQHNTIEAKVVTQMPFTIIWSNTKRISNHSHAIALYENLRILPNFYIFPKLPKRLKNSSEIKILFNSEVQIWWPAEEWPAKNVQLILKFKIYTGISNYYSNLKVIFWRKANYNKFYLTGLDNHLRLIQF